MRPSCSAPADRRRCARWGNMTQVPKASVSSWSTRPTSRAGPVAPPMAAADPPANPVTPAALLTPPPRPNEPPLLSAGARAEEGDRNREGARSGSRPDPTKKPSSSRSCHEDHVRAGAPIGPAATGPAGRVVRPAGPLRGIRPAARHHALRRERRFRTRGRTRVAPDDARQHRALPSHRQVPPIGERQSRRGAPHQERRATRSWIKTWCSP